MTTHDYSYLKYIRHADKILHKIFQLSSLKQSESLQTVVC